MKKNTKQTKKATKPATVQKADKPIAKTKTPVSKKSKKIEFGRLMPDGKVIKAKGDYYKMANGVEIGITKDTNGRYYATELSTGKLVTLRKGETSVLDTVNFVEKYSSEIKKAIDTNSQIPAPISKPAKQPTAKKTKTPAASKPTVAKATQKSMGKSPSASNNSVRTVVTAKQTTVKTAAPKKTEATPEKRRVYKSLPKGYSVVQGTVAQSDGTILIHNGKPLFKQNKDGTTQQAKDSHGKPAHKTAALVVDPKAFNEAKKSSVGEIHRGNTKYIDKEPKAQRNYAVVKDKGGKVTVAKVKTIKKFDDNGKNADPALVEINHERYGLPNRSGVDFETFDKNRITNTPLKLSDKDVFPEQQPRAVMGSHTKHNVLRHIKTKGRKK